MDERLADEIVAAALAATDRGVRTIDILVTVASSLGTLLADNSQSVGDMRKIAAALGDGVLNTAEKVFADNLDRR